MGPRLRAGKKVRAPTMSTVPMSRRVKVTPDTGKTAGALGYGLFARQASGQGQHRHDEQEAPDERGQAQGQIVPGSIAREARKGAAVVADSTK